jgi:hypothetical protein
MSAIWWGLGGKRKRNGAAVVSKRAARGELTARLFLRFYPPGENPDAGVGVGCAGFAAS